MKKGFTLAETLITMAIIGVVAILTLPNLVEGYKKKVYIAQLQRVYNLIANSYAQLLVDEDVAGMGDTYMKDEGGPERFLKKYLKVTKDCGNAATERSTHGCFMSQYKAIKGTDTSAPAIYSSSYCVQINIGASICMAQTHEDSVDYSYNGSTGEYETDTYHGGSHIIVDINGKKGPNKAGRDLFTFYLYNDGQMSDSYNVSTSDWCADANATGYSAKCFDKIINDDWVMDY